MVAAVVGYAGKMLGTMNPGDDASIASAFPGIVSVQLAPGFYFEYQNS